MAIQTNANSVLVIAVRQDHRDDYAPGTEQDRVFAVALLFRASRVSRLNARKESLAWVGFAFQTPPAADPTISQFCGYEEV